MFRSRFDSELPLKLIWGQTAFAADADETKAVEIVEDNCQKFEEGPLQIDDIMISTDI